MVELVVLNLAYVALLCSTFTRTIRKLRGLLIAGAICFVFYGLAANVASIVAWNIAIGGLHAYRMFQDIRRERSVELTPGELEIKDLVLGESSDFDFHMLWCMGRATTYDQTAIIAAGTKPGTVGLILDGTARVELSGRERFLRRGALLGEMSFVSGGDAFVDVVAVDSVTIHEWDQRDLVALDQTHPPSAKAFQQLLARDLVAKTHV